MKRTFLLAVSAAITCGTLVMIIPLYLWHQTYFPYEPATLFALRKETLEGFKAQWGLQEPVPITLLFAALTFSFVVSAVTFISVKKRL